MVPLLERDHRVIRIDLLGFGGSEKPKEGYSMENQGRLVALALGRLEVQGAVVVGHSLGFDVATAVARESSELVDRLVNIDEQSDPSYGSLPFLAKLGFVPVLGQTIWRVTPDFAIRDGYSNAFAPGYDLGDFGDQVVDDFRAMTYTSYDSSPSEVDDYENQEPLNQRVQADAIPLLVIFGSEDQFYDDPSEAAHAFDSVLGARIEMIEGAGHSPNVEKPADGPPDPGFRRGGRRSRSHAALIRGASPSGPRPSLDLHVGLRHDSFERLRIAGEELRRGRAYAERHLVARAPVVQGGHLPGNHVQVADRVVTLHLVDVSANDCEVSVHHLTGDVAAVRVPPDGGAHPSAGLGPIQVGDRAERHLRWDWAVHERERCGRAAPLCRIVAGGRIELRTSCPRQRPSRATPSAPP